MDVPQHTKVWSRHLGDEHIHRTAKGGRVSATDAEPSLFEWNIYTSRKTRASVWTDPSSPEPAPGETEEEDGEDMVLIHVDQDYRASPRCV